MAGLDPAINFCRLAHMDGRLKAGHDKGTEAPAGIRQSIRPCFLFHSSYSGRAASESG